MHTEPFILGDTPVHTSMGIFSVCGNFQAKGRFFFYENTLTGSAAIGFCTGEGELCFQDMVEETHGITG